MQTRSSIIEGSFEFALNEIVEEHLDMSVFEPRYHNDATGRLAYDPKVLVKVVVYGYYRGFVSSRRIAEACCRNVMFMALSADSRPHFTTIAAFVSSLEHSPLNTDRYACSLKPHRPANPRHRDTRQWT